MTEPWSFLPPAPRKAVARLGFAAPTPVQRLTLPPALAGGSFRAVAPTGTGKTLAYLIPAWQALRKPKAKVLVLVPTRELAYQVSQMLQELDPDAGRGAALAIGGHPKRDQAGRLGQGWGVLVATPGRLLEFLEEGTVTLRDVALVVLDEFDKLIGMGFKDQIASVLKRVPKGSQKLLFSATDQEEGSAAELGLGDLALLTAERESGSAGMREEFYFLKSDKKKGALLQDELARTGGQAIVFVANRDKANHLQGLLKLRGLAVRALHGNLRQSDRARVYQDFKEGAFPVLVATDLAARGLDMPQVDLIVNFDLPRHYKDYVHRTGRAGRRGRASRCVSYAGPHEYLPMRNLEKEFPTPLPVHPDYAQRDKWFVDAKRNHDLEVKREAGKEFLRREQGLPPKGPKA